MDTLSPHAQDGNTPPQKACTTCGKLFPTTPDFFHRRSNGGLHAQCKTCRSNHAKSKEIKYLPSDEKTCSLCGKTYPGTTEYFSRAKGNKDGLNARCKQCKNERGSISYREHREEHRIRNAHYRSLHREEKRARDARYRASHREQRQHYLEEKRLEISEQRSVYYLRHQEHLRRYTKQYRQTEQGKISHRAAQHNREARKRTVGGSHTLENLRQQLGRQKNRCYYCHKQLSTHNWEVDHVVPVSRGGSNSIDNIVIACSPCNRSKHDKFLHEWVKGGRLL